MKRTLPPIYFLFSGAANSELRCENQRQKLIPSEGWKPSNDRKSKLQAFGSKRKKANKSEELISGDVIAKTEHANSCRRSVD